MSLPLEPPELAGHAISARLKVEQTITFDPLGVATVLPNERAARSAVRLYTQYPRDSFRWPHLMMVGGALPPLGVLVDHVLAHNRAIHPALSMALAHARRLPVRSTMVFKELPLDFSNGWIGEFCNFRPSAVANNDFLVINIDEDAEGPRRRSLATRLLGAAFNAVGLGSGLALTAGLVLACLVGDVWAAALFAIYDAHWLASTLVAWTPLIGPRQPPAHVVADATRQYAVYERKEGGTVVFKGRKDAFEAWFRQTWQYNPSFKHGLLHWSWIATGTAAAIGSTAALVNMYAYFQLGFLGILLLSSLAELLLARAAREIELAPYQARVQFFGDNASRSEAMIRCALEARPACQVDGLDWIELGLLPDMPPFRSMQDALQHLAALQPGEDEETVAKLVEAFRARGLLRSAATGPPKLWDRVADELSRSGRQRCAHKPS